MPHTIEHTICSIAGILRCKENYVERPYQTIGGMWTVDTWRLGDAIYQVMDEGWTNVIRAPGLVVWSSGSAPVRFEEGDQSALEALLARLRAQ